MLTREEFHALLQEGPLILDGATGSNLRLAGMPKGCSTESWVLEHPDALMALQRSYAEAGSRIFAYKRDTMLVAMNPGTENLEIELDGTYEPVYTIGAPAVKGTTLSLPEQSFVVLKSL